MENLPNKHFCIFCNAKFNEAEMKNESKGYVCTQCAHYRRICRAIFYSQMVIIFVVLKAFVLNPFEAWLWEINYFDFYDSGTALKIKLLSGTAHFLAFILLLFLTRFLIKTVTQHLSVNRYRKLGTILELEETPIPIQRDSIIDIKKAYIAGEYKNASEEEKQLIEKYRTAPDNIREEVLMILSLDPVPDRKKKKYRSYSMQEASIILTYRNSSKAIQNKVFDVLNKSKRA